MIEPDRTAEIIVVHAQQDPPAAWDGSVFLAGPTPRDPQVPSWRPAAVDLLRKRWLEDVGARGRLVVFVPEARGGGFEGTWDGQVAWEDDCLNACDVIAFWVPRDMTTLPGLTTNVEWGRWESSGKVVLGAPPEAPGLRYMRHYAQRYDVPTTQTLDDTVAAALTLLRQRVLQR